MIVRHHSYNHNYYWQNFIIVIIGIVLIFALMEIMIQSIIAALFIIMAMVNITNDHLYLHYNFECNKRSNGNNYHGSQYDYQNNPYSFSLSLSLLITIHNY